MLLSVNLPVIEQTFVLLQLWELFIAIHIINEDFPFGHFIVFNFDFQNFPTINLSGSENYLLRSVHGYKMLVI